MSVTETVPRLLILAFLLGAPCAAGRSGAAGAEASAAIPSRGAPVAVRQEPPHGIEDDLESLIAPLASRDNLTRKKGVRRFRRIVDAAAAERLVGLLPELEPAYRKALADALGSGGPWMPGVLRAVERGGAAGAAACSIVHSALAMRALKDDPPPVLDALSIFGEGAGFAFPGTWPRSVPLDELLDWINFLAVPTHPLVLSPDLGVDAAGGLAVGRTPVSGPAPVVMDLLLMERGLGVRLLETVTLVSRDGRGFRELDARGQDFDRVLLERILRSLSGTRDAACRRAALRALACLDPPGFFEGYLEEIRSGSRGDCLHYLLTAGASARLAARLGLDGDQKTVAGLVNLWESEEEGMRKRALVRLLLLCPDDLRVGVFDSGEVSPLARLLFHPAWDEEALTAAIRLALEEAAGERIRIGLQASLAFLPHSERLRTMLLAEIADLWPVERSTTAMIDRCLMTMGSRIGDETLAALVGTACSVPQPAGSREAGISKKNAVAAVSLQGVLEAATRFGGEKCLRAVMERLRADGADTITAGVVPALRALESLSERLGIDPLDPAHGLCEGIDPLADAALRVVFSPEESARSEAARRLCEGLSEKSGSADLVSLVPAVEVADAAGPLLERLASGGTAMTPALREALVRSALSSSAGDPVAAGRTRLDLIGILGERMDPLLERALRNLEFANQQKSYTVEIRLF